MRTILGWVLFSASAAMAQLPVPIVLPVSFPVQLKEYLAISDDQVVRISNVKQQIYNLQAPKMQRQAQLQQEISVETAKTTPDAAALGTRYAELELIRRDLDALQKSVVSQIQPILGADQKAKLATLQQALSLYSVACSAVGESLLAPPVIPVLTAGIIGQAAPTAVIPYASFLLGSIGFSSTCGAVPLAFRSGDFSGTILPQP